MPVLGLEEAEREPWSSYKRNEKRKDHRKRRTDRHGTHIRPHKTRNKYHRQDGSYNRKRCKNSRISYLVDSRDGCLHFRHSAHGKMPVNVLRNDNRVVHDDAGDKNQGKQRYPVQGIIKEIVYKQRQRKCYRHGCEYHQAASPAEEKTDNNGNGNNSADQMLKKGEHLFRSGFTVVPGLGHGNSGGNDRSFQRLDFCQHFVRKSCCIGSFPFCNREGYSRIFTLLLSVMRCRSVTEKRVILNFFRPVDNRRYILEVYCIGIIDTDNDISHIFGCLEKLSGFDREIPVHLLECSRRHLTIGCLDLTGYLQRSNPVLSKLLCVEYDSELTLQPSVKVDIADIFDFLEFVGNLARHPPELIWTVAVTPERQGQGRHIVNRYFLDKRHLHSRRHLVHIFHNGSPELHHTLFGIVPYIVANGNQRKIFLGSRIDIVNTFDFCQVFLHGFCYPLLNFFSTSTGITEIEIYQWNGNLRLFLTGGHKRCQNPYEERCDHQQRCQLRIDEQLRKHSCNTLSHRHDPPLLLDFYLKPFLSLPDIRCNHFFTFSQAA